LAAYFNDKYVVLAVNTILYCSMHRRSAKEMSTICSGLLQTLPMGKHSREILREILRCLHQVWRLKACSGMRRS